MTDTVRKQILTVRDTGYTNMFDTNRVLEIAELFDFDELNEWLPKNKKEYCDFILFGDDTQ